MSDKKAVGEGVGFGDGSDSGSESQAAWTDPITVVIAVNEMNRLAMWDAARAAYAAAGDTVVIDGATTAVGSRGMFSIFGLAAFLTQIDGSYRNYGPPPAANFPAVNPFRLTQQIGSYQPPTPYNAYAIPVMAGVSNYGDTGFTMLANSVRDPSITLNVSNGGATDQVTQISVTATMSDFPTQGDRGSVTFYCGEWVQSADVDEYGNATVTLTGSDLGTPDNYSLWAVYWGVTGPGLIRWNSASASGSITVT